MGDSDIEQKDSSYAAEQRRYHALSGSGSDMDTDDGPNAHDTGDMRNPRRDRTDEIWDYYPTAASSYADNRSSEKSSSVYVTSGMRHSNVQEQEMRVFSKKYGSIANGQDSVSFDDNLEGVTIHHRFHGDDFSKNRTTSSSASQSSRNKSPQDDESATVSEKQCLLGGFRNYEAWRADNLPKAMQHRAADQGIDFSLRPSTAELASCATSIASRRLYTFSEGAAETRTSDAHSGLMQHSHWLEAPSDSSSVRMVPISTSASGMIDSQRYDRLNFDGSSTNKNGRYNKSKTKKANKKQTNESAVKAGNLPGNRGEDTIDSLMAFIGGGSGEKVTGESVAGAGKSGKSKKKQQQTTARNIANGESDELKGEDIAGVPGGKARSNSSCSLPDKSAVMNAAKDAVAASSKKPLRKQSSSSNKCGDDLAFDTENAVAESSADFVIVSKKKKSSPDKRQKEAPCVSSSVAAAAANGNNVKRTATVLNANSTALFGSKARFEDESSAPNLSFPPLASSNRCSSTGDVSSVVTATSRDESDRDSVASVPSGVGSGVPPGLLTYALAIAVGGKPTDDIVTAATQSNTDAKDVSPTCFSHDTDVAKIPMPSLASANASNSAIDVSDRATVFGDEDGIAIAVKMSGGVVDQPSRAVVTVDSDISSSVQPSDARKKPPSVVFLNEQFDSELSNPLGISFGFDEACDVGGAGSEGGLHTPVTERDVSEEFERKCHMDDSGTGSVDGSDIADDAKSSEPSGASASGEGATGNSGASSQVVYLDDSAVIAASGLGRRLIPDLAMLNPTYNYVKTVAFLLGEWEKVEKLIHANSPKVVVYSE